MWLDAPAAWQSDPGEKLMYSRNQVDCHVRIDDEDGVSNILDRTFTWERDLRR